MIRIYLLDLYVRNAMQNPKTEDKYMREDDPELNEAVDYIN